MADARWRIERLAAVGRPCHEDNVAGLSSAVLCGLMRDDVHVTAEYPGRGIASNSTVVVTASKADRSVIPTLASICRSIGDQLWPGEPDEHGAIVRKQRDPRVAAAFRGKVVANPGPTTVE